MTKIVIVLAGSTIGSVLSICRTASKCNSKAYILTFNKHYRSIYENSKYVYKVIYSQKDLLYKEINTIIMDNNSLEKPILYTTTDEQCVFISQQRKEYEKLVDLCVPSNEIIYNLNTKGKAENFASNNGLLVPKSQVINSHEDISFILSDFIFPIIVKPISTTVKKEVGFKFKIINKNTFLDLCKNWRNGIVLCQEYVPGNDEDYKFYIFYRKNNKKIIECIGEKTMQSHGIMTIGTTRYDSELSKISRSFINKIDYVGIGGLEFKKYNGKYYFIEMSTRPEGFLPISDMAKVSLSLASFKSMNNQIFDYEITQNNNVVYSVSISYIIENIKFLNIKKLLKYIMMLIFKRQFYSVELYINARCYFIYLLKKLLRL